MSTTATYESSVTELVQAAKDGEPGAWDELVRRFDGLVRATARSYRLQDSDVCDVSQTTWMRLVEHLPRITRPEALGGWLATTAGRECLRLLGRSRREMPGEDNELAEVIDLRTPQPDQVVVDDAVASALWAVVARLPERGRDVIVALYGEAEHDYDTIVTAVGMPRGSIGPTRQRCLRRLRSMLAEQDLGPDAA